VELYDSGRGHSDSDRLCVAGERLEKCHGELTAGRHGVQVDYSSVEVGLHGTEFHQNLTFEGNTCNVWL
jgi:hypothetical protein